MNPKQFNPYNPLNVLITPEAVRELFAKYGLDITVKSIDVYVDALTHTSYTESEYITQLRHLEATKPADALPLRKVCNERLEFLGDSIIKCIISKYLYLRYPEEKNEGHLTKLKTKIENRKHLAIFARRLGIGRYMLISRPIEENSGREADKLLEDCFEAFMGALYLDQGFMAVHDYIWQLLETEVDYAELLYRDTNFKDQLLRFFHQNGWSHPVYSDVTSENVDGTWMFTCSVSKLDGELVATATETSKKRAEQKCAMLALVHYGQISPHQVVSDFD